MTRTRARRAGAPGAERGAAAALPPVPPDLCASRLALGGEELVVLSFSLEDKTGTIGPRLTPAEAEVLELVLSGESAATIARRRRTSRRTVANQLASIHKKLGVGSTLELLALARPREG